MTDAMTLSADRPTAPRCADPEPRHSAPAAPLRGTPPDRKGTTEAARHPFGPEATAHGRPQLCPLVVDAKQLAELLGSGVRTVRSHDAAGKLPAPLRIGGRVVWRVAEIHAWLAADAPDRAAWEARRAARRR